VKSPDDIAFAAVIATDDDVLALLEPQVKLTY
jgi:hypothetical protein